MATESDIKMVPVWTPKPTEKMPDRPYAYTHNSPPFTGEHFRGRVDDGRYQRFSARHSRGRARDGDRALVRLTRLVTIMIAMVGPSCLASINDRNWQLHVYRVTFRVDVDTGARVGLQSDKHVGVKWAHMRLHAQSLVALTVWWRSRLCRWGEALDCRLAVER